MEPPEYHSQRDLNSAWFELEVLHSLTVACGLPEPQFPHLYHGDNNSSYLIVL